MKSLYDTDFVAWSERQAALLREGRYDEADMENIAEEIESLSRSDKRDLRSRTYQVLMHLLKLQAQPHYEGIRGWKASIREQRRQLRVLLEDSPSLRSYFCENLETNYRDAVEGAADETGLAAGSFPAECPWSMEQILDSSFFPEAPQTTRPGRKFFEEHQ